MPHSFFPVFPFFFFLPPSLSPLNPCDTTHYSPGSNSSSRTLHTVTWLTVLPLPPPPSKEHTGFPAHPAHCYRGPGPYLSRGVFGVSGGGVALPLPLAWGLALAFGLLCLAGGGGALRRYFGSGGVSSSWP